MQDTSMRLNAFKITTLTKDNTFFKKVCNVIESLNIYKSNNNKKLKYLTFHDVSGVDFFSLKISNTNYYTFSFKMLSCVEKFEEYKSMNKKDRDALNIHLDTFSDEYLTEVRYSLLTAVLTLLKEENLYSQTKIKKLSFGLTFYSNEYIDKLKVIKFTPSKDNFYSVYSLNQWDKYKYSIPVAKYQAWIYNINKLLYECRQVIPNKLFSSVSENSTNQNQSNVPVNSVNLPQGAPILENDSNTINEEDIYKLLHEKNEKSLTSKEIIDTLEYVINTKLRHHLVKILKDTSNRYFLQCNYHHQNIRINKINLTFSPLPDNDSNFFKLSQKKSRTHHIRATKKRKFDIYSKHKISYSFEINSFFSSNKKILDKYNTQGRRHDFTLNDDIEDITQKIIGFTSKYRVLLIDSKDANNKIQNNSHDIVKTIKQFDEKVIKSDDNIQTILNINSANLKVSLSKLFQK